MITAGTTAFDTSSASRKTISATRNGTEMRANQLRGNKAKAEVITAKQAKKVNKLARITIKACTRTKPRKLLKVAPGALAITTSGNNNTEPIFTSSAKSPAATNAAVKRSEERRVGKECA